jgi:hypothetical protein
VAIPATEMPMHGLRDAENRDAEAGIETQRDVVV